MSDQTDKPENYRKDSEQNFTVEDRQIEAYKMDIQGYKNMEIAKKLDVSISTIEKDLKKFKGEITSKLRKMENRGLNRALYDAILQFNLVRDELWQTFSQEKDSLRKQKLLDSITTNAVAKFEMIKNAPQIPSDKQVAMQELFGNM